MKQVLEDTKSVGHTAVKSSVDLASGSLKVVGSVIEVGTKTVVGTSHFLINLFEVNMNVVRSLFK